MNVPRMCWEEILNTGPLTMDGKATTWKNLMSDRWETFLRVGRAKRASVSPRSQESLRSNCEGNQGREPRERDAVVPRLTTYVSHRCVSGRVDAIYYTYRKATIPCGCLFFGRCFGYCRPKLLLQ